ncbi:uncharacterized protein [Haliotis asinina]|uniref:uncharacterized protein n=1 Tax=Haliotis asinina TaxID=109174 RepID=UPI003531BBFF
MTRMISLRIILGLFHLTCVIRTGNSCGGNSALKVVEMCKGGSSTDHHFYLHGSPAGGVQPCVCNLTITGASSSVNFTPLSVTNTAAACGGTLTLVDGSMRDCGWLSGADIFSFSGTSAVTFAYNSPDVRFCVEVEKHSAEANISIECTLSTRTTTTLSSPSTTTTFQTTTVNIISSSISTTTASPVTTLSLDISTLSSTSTPTSTEPLSTSTHTTSTSKSTTVSSSENQSTSPVIETSTEGGKPEGSTVEHAPFPVAAVAGGVGAGLLLLLVVVIVVILCYRRSRHIDKLEDDKQEESKGPTEVITVTNSLYESSADSNTQPTKPLTTQHQDNNQTVQGQLPPELISDITPGIADKYNAKPCEADQPCGTNGSSAPQDETPDEHRDGPSDMYAVVNKPKKSLEVTNVTKHSVHTDPESVSKETSPPPTDDSAVYANVNESSPKTKL